MKTQTDNITIRLATANDAPALSGIARRAKAHWGYPAEWLELWDDDLTVQPEDCDGESIWLLEADAAVLGWGEIRVNDETAHLENLWVDPPCMGLGLGKQLFHHLVHIAQSRNATRVTIEADPFAAGFYAHMGARVVGEIHSQSLPGRSLPLMQLCLRSAGNTTISTE